MSDQSKRTSQKAQSENSEDESDWGRLAAGIVALGVGAVGLWWAGSKLWSSSGNETEGRTSANHGSYAAVDSDESQNENLESFRRLQVNDSETHEWDYGRHQTSFESTERLPAPSSAVVSSPNQWHSEKKLRDAVSTFHDKCARQPAKLEDARMMHNQIISEFNALLRGKNVGIHLEYTGSSYEGVKVAKNSSDDDLEFDVMVILKGGDELVAHPISDKPGYARLSNKITPQQSTSEFVDSVKLVQSFFGVLQKCINVSENWKSKLLPRMHGPAVQMDAYSDEYGRRKFYSVDMVPTYRVNGKFYVSKPLPSDDIIDRYAWRQSFSLEEKNLLVGADRGNECRKKVLRILKVIRNREAGLASLTSYHLKTALFRIMNKNKTWKECDIGERLINVLQELEQCLASGLMEHYFIPGINLFDSYRQMSLNNMRDRIRKIITKETEMIKILQ